MNLPFGFIIKAIGLTCNKINKFLFLPTIKQSNLKYWEHQNNQPYNSVGSLIEFKFEFDNGNSLQARNTRMRIRSIGDIDIEHVNVSIETLTSDGYITEILHFGKVRKDISTYLETNFPPYNIYLLDNKIVPTLKYLQVNFIEIFYKNNERYYFGQQHKSSICMSLDDLFSWEDYDGISYNTSSLEKEKLETYIWINYHYPNIVKRFIHINDSTIKRQFHFIVNMTYWTWIWYKRFIKKSADCLTFDKPAKKIVKIYKAHPMHKGNK